MNDVTTQLILMTIVFLLALGAGFFLYYKLTIEPEKKNKKSN